MEPQRGGGRTGSEAEGECNLQLKITSLLLLVHVPCQANRAPGSGAVWKVLLRRHPEGLQSRRIWRAAVQLWPVPMPFTQDASQAQHDAGMD